MDVAVSTRPVSQPSWMRDDGLQALGLPCGEGVTRPEATKPRVFLSHSSASTVQATGGPLHGRAHAQRVIRLARWR